MAEISKKMKGSKLRNFPQGRLVDQVVLVGGATRMPSVQASYFMPLNCKTLGSCSLGSDITAKLHFLQMTSAVMFVLKWRGET